MLNCVKKRNNTYRTSVNRVFPNIYYDYEGIEKWRTGDWKAKQEGPKAYKDFYDSVKNIIKMRFVKVAGHSRNKYNDIADQLSKKVH